MQEYLDKITLTTILVVATFLVATIFYRRGKLYNLLYGIICLNLFSEVMALIAITTKRFGFIHFYNLNFFIQPILWFLLIKLILKNQLSSFLMITLFVSFAIFNLLFFEKFGLNEYTFICASFMYIGYYIWAHFRLLRKEKLEHFSSKEFLLLSSPLVFFFGISILLCFGDSGLKSTPLLGRSLYNIIQNFTNLIYYSLLITYIIKSRNEGKQKLELHD
ncbi:hypothetical protein [Nonlabens sp.]|uniref:hypothetical protein n=1 Tax=Nonlabens sp. TaxID=1888209 RepID=UPI003266A822